MTKIFHLSAPSLLVLFLLSMAFFLPPIGCAATVSAAESADKDCTSIEGLLISPKGEILSSDKWSAYNSDRCAAVRQQISDAKNAPASASSGSLDTWSKFVDSLVSLMNKGIGTLIAAGFAIYFYGLWSNILKFGEETDAEKKKLYFFWGIIILFVMVSIIGILRIMQNTIFGTETATPSYGAGYEARCPGGKC